MKRTDLEGKVAIVTGSSKGIGKAIAIALAAKKVKIVLNGRDAEKLEQTAREISSSGYEVFPIQGDVGIYSDCEKLIKQTVEKYGTLDILINNAGLSMEGSIGNTSPEVFEKVIHTNILGVIYPTKAALPYLMKTNGSVIFTGSIAGFMGLPNYSAYSASKMSLTAIVQSLKIELEGTGVHVGINYVGFAENPSDKTFLNQNGEIEQVPIREQFKRMPLQEIANIFVKGIEKRRYKQTPSLLGKTTNIAQRFFPTFFEWLMTRKYKTEKAAVG
ncbi:MAG: SDR family oxidoreductase [Bacteroidales bacterium]|nr:SDR family oxidoreductase [Bacteroidales bacterium]MCF8456946.1 SDR family oxidoreductase [Bacteroidales bacterium]